MQLRDALVRFFPFMLVMWSLAGALHPAIDLCAAKRNAARWRRCSSARPAGSKSWPASSWPCGRWRRRRSGGICSGWAAARWPAAIFWD